MTLWHFGGCLIYIDLKGEITGELIFALGLTLLVSPRTHFAIAKMRSYFVSS